MPFQQEYRVNIYRPRREVTDHWINILKERGGYWLHDGNPKRPYAELTGGKISNFYADCSKITKDTRLCTQAAEHLHKLFAGVMPRPDAYCGSAYGSITLAHELARQKEAEAWFTVKREKGAMELDRFDFSPAIKTVAMVEDTITEFKTTQASIDAIQKKTREDSLILSCVLCLVNRSGKREIGGYKIISLIEVSARTWARGENPFTGGPERVEPVRPKQHWGELTGKYD